MTCFLHYLSLTHFNLCFCVNLSVTINDKIQFDDGLWCLMPLSTIPGISVLSWRSVLLVEETGVPGENHNITLLYNQYQCKCLFY